MNREEAESTVHGRHSRCRPCRRHCAHTCLNLQLHRSYFTAGGQRYLRAQYSRRRLRCDDNSYIYNRYDSQKHPRKKDNPIWRISPGQGTDIQATLRRYPANTGCLCCPGQDRLHAGGTGGVPQGGYEGFRFCNQ